MISWRSDQTLVRRMRVKGHKLDPLAAQLRLENLLQAADLYPTWLPPAAVVCLRNLRDPLPRALNLRSRSPTQSLAWQQAISAAVQEQIRGAARPIKAELPANTTAVIFKDQAELLACLAADWAAGRLSSRWWWRSLFKTQELATLVFDEWLSAPQYVPAALELVALRRGSEQFARRLSGEQAKALLRRVTECFDLPDLQAAIAEGLAQLNRPLAVGRSRTPQPHEPSSYLPDHTAPPPPPPPPAPWRHLAPETVDQIPGLERRCLIGVALTIRRAPATARSASFARATLAWLSAAADVPESVEHANSVESHSHRGARSNEDLPASAYAQALPLSEFTASLTASLTTGAAHESLSAATDSQRSDARRDPAVELPEESPPPLDSSSSEFHLTGRSESDQALRAPRRLPGSEKPVTRVQTANAPGLSDSTATRGEEAPLFPGAETPLSPSETNLFTLDECRIETKFGGVFYLINLGLFLNLYGDFTMPAQKGLSLSIFDFVDLIARRLLKSAAGDDPLWGLLAQLAGRTETESTGEAFDPPDEWRLPAHWLEAFPGERQFVWTTEGERLLVKHPAGFMVLDVPLQDSPAKQVKRELRVYNAVARRPKSRKAFVASQSDSRLGQWLDWIIPYIRVRLCRALGLDDASDPGPSLCAQAASILLTETHLDIFFALSEHPLEIRLAGLDRDSGWVPAAGRFIRFHYR